MKKKINKQAVKEIIGLAIMAIERDCGTKMCKDYQPYCANCQNQILLGSLREYYDNLENF